MRRYREGLNTEHVRSARLMIIKDVEGKKTVLVRLRREKGLKERIYLIKG